MKKISTRNENVNLSEPLFISCTKGKRIKITPFFIKHNTNDDDLYYRIELFRLNELTDAWQLVNNGTWNIYPNSIEDLFNFISATTQLKTRETVAVLEAEEDKLQFLKGMLESGSLMQLVSEGKLKAEDIADLKDSVRIIEIESAIKTFKNLLEQSDTEKDFENWCANNSWVFGNYYVATDKIHQISNAEKVDCLIKNVINQYRDIIEFKKPSLPVLSYDSTHKNYYFSVEVSKAISQAINYSDIFSIEANRGLHRHEEIVSYYPKSIIVIGRSNKFTPDQIKALHGLNSRLNGISIKTYDDLLAQAKTLLATVKNNTNDQEDIQNTVAIAFDDDDIPF